MSVTPADLTGTERAVLLVLMAESRPVPNPDLIALGPKLEKAGRDKLKQVRKVTGKFEKDLMAKGCHDPLHLSAKAPRNGTLPRCL